MRASMLAMAAAAALACAGGAATAEEVGAIVPGTVNFQARLAKVSEGTATPLTGIQHVAFRLYDAAEGGTLVWARSFPVTCTADGTFNIVLDDGGSVLGSPAVEKLVDAFQGTARYFELEVEGVGTLKPRMRVPTAPYAFQSQYALWGEDGFEVGGTLRVADDAEFKGAVQAGSGKLDSLTVASGGGSAGSMSVTGTVTVASGKANEAKGVVPVGGILIWTNSTVPSGWAVCDGSTNNGVATPDLRGWFVRGAREAGEVNSTGGVARVKLTVEQIPSHSHEYVYPKTMDAGKNHFDDEDGHVWRNSITTNTVSTGGGNAHENRPPFFAVYYIMRVR